MRRPQVVIPRVTCELDDGLYLVLMHVAGEGGFQMRLALGAGPSQAEALANAQLFASRIGTAIGQIQIESDRKGMVQG